MRRQCRQLMGSWRTPKKPQIMSRSFRLSLNCKKGYYTGLILSGKRYNFPARKLHLTLAGIVITRKKERPNTAAVACENSFIDWEAFQLPSKSSQ